MSREFWAKLRIVGWSLTFIWFLIYELNFWLNLQTDHYQLSVLRGIVGMLGTFLVMFGFYRLRQYDNMHNHGTGEKETNTSQK